MLEVSTHGIPRYLRAYPLEERGEHSGYGATRQPREVAQRTIQHIGPMIECGGEGLVELADQRTASPVADAHNGQSNRRTGRNGQMGPDTVVLSLRFPN
jgi:hypothetical protein